MTHPITLPEIIARSAEHFGFTVYDLCGPNKTDELIRARRIAMYLCRELTVMSLLSIAECFGKEHTVVMWAHGVVRKSPELTELANQVAATIRANHLNEENLT